MKVVLHGTDAEEAFWEYIERRARVEFGTLAERMRVRRVVLELPDLNGQTQGTDIQCWFQTTISPADGFSRLTAR